MKSRNIAEAANKVFIDASRACPNSVPPQAAIIAMRCQRSGLNPQELMPYVLQNSLSLTDTANDDHAKHNVPHIVDLAETERIIRSDFSMASRMMDLPRSNLTEVARGFRRLRRVSTLQRDYLLGELVDEMLDERD